MNLDAKTLFFSLMVNVLLMSIALSFNVRWKSRSGIRAWNASLMIQAASWALLIAAYRALPRELATLGVTGLTTAMSFVYVAAKTYLREPVVRAWMWGVPAVTTVVHWLVFSNYQVRIAVTNAALAMQIGWIAWVLLRPRARPDTDGRWRWLAATALMMSGVMVTGRFLLVTFAPEAYPSFEAGHWINTLGLVLTNADLTVGTLAFLLAHRDEAERELQKLATTDGLTGTMNRRRWMESAAVHVRLAERHVQPVTVMMLDIDHFKRLNDTRGHAAGDGALVRFARALQAAVRQPDLVGRYGGEEFCVLLPQSDAVAARAIDQRLREALVRDVAPALGFPITYTAGVAEWRPGATLEALLATADAALYRGKAAGRDRLEVAEVPGLSPAGARTPPTTG